MRYLFFAIAAAFVAGCSADTENAAQALPGGIPDVVAAQGLSQHYIKVEFVAPAGPEAERTENFSIVSLDGNVIGILAALLSNDAMFVTLTTESQDAAEYEVMACDGASTNGCPLRTAFAASGSSEPVLVSAVPLSNTELLLTFSKEMDETSAENVLFYRIADPDLNITEAVLESGEETVLLTTSPQQNIEYLIKVSNVAKEGGDILIDPTQNTATFHGIAVDDTESPQVNGAVALSSTSVIVSFSEPLADHSDLPLNFSVERTSDSEDIPVIDAALRAHNTQIVLTVLPLFLGEEHLLTVSDNVVDRKSPDGNPIDPAANTTLFTFTGISLFDDDEPPRVVGALSLNNIAVQVTFTKPMGSSAIQPKNYVIVQENQNPEAAILKVIDAAFPDENDRSTVYLSTLSQNEVTYKLTAVGVKDLEGNQLAPQELLVDPSSARFRGSPASCSMCDNGAPGSDGLGFCSSDADCVLPAPCASGCEGICTADCSLIDTDGDGLPDHIEQRGWGVTVELTARLGFIDRKQTVSRDVTSNPLVADTDGDGLSDRLERQLATDPRDSDTDGDGLDDASEFNVFFSSPTDQDSDEDQLDDFLEVSFYKTSPILADTDGDGLDDDTEILSLNRDPRIADLPEWDIDVGEILLQIDERYTFVDETGTIVTEISSTSFSFEESNSTEDIEYDSTLTSLGWEAGVKVTAKPFGFATLDKDALTLEGFGKGFGNGDTHRGTDTTTTEASQEAYESSLTKGKEFTTTRQVTREVFGASIEAPLTVRSTGDISFSISNLELSVLQLNRDRTRYIPIATLVPNAELLGGEPTTLNLGPLIGERGPIILGSREVFPLLVENLLRAPRGPIIKPSNFDITDEFGRNFAFASQEVNDRTATLVIDFGDGTSEEFRVAVAGAMDDKGFVGPAGEFVGGFDEEGRPKGIPLDYVLQDILRFSKENDTTPDDAILAGDNGVAETVAAGDDVQEVPVGTPGLDDRRVIVSAGDNGILDSVASNDEDDDNDILDDLSAVTLGYALSHTCNTFTRDRIIEPNDEFGDGIISTEPNPDSDDEFAQGTFELGGSIGQGEDIIDPGPNGIIDTVPGGDDQRRGPGDICDEESDCPDGPAPEVGACDGRMALSRFRDSKTGDRNRIWFVYTDGEIPIGADFGDFILTARMNLFLSFEQDIDRDGIFARHEYTFGTDDRKRDTDGDGLGDFTEIRDGWLIEVEGSEPFRAYPDPRLADSDGDGVCDAIEQLCGTDPRRRDTDGDGISDFDELNDDIVAGGVLASDTLCSPADLASGDCCASEIQTPNECPEWMAETDLCAFASRCGIENDPHAGEHLNPLDPDTDGDGLLDGIELELDANPLDDSDAGDFLDTDGDGIADSAEILGWDVTVFECSNTCGFAYDGECQDTNSFCSLGSANALQSCSNSAQCNANATCNIKKECAGITFPDGFGGETVIFGGEPCSSDADCIFIIPLECLNLSTCNSGSQNAGASCVDDSDCDDFPTGSCAPLCDSGSDCADCGSRVTTTRVFSDPTRGDTDFDGLPDFVEQALASNPASIDTDGDGLLDFDEFDAFAQFFQLNFELENFFLTDAGSQQIGTDLNSQDTDGDGLTDAFELLDGWRVFGLVDAEPRDVTSNPALSDSDLDGLTDSQEYVGVDGIRAGDPLDSGDATDPSDPDTDGDGRLDGDEIALGANPLIPDAFVTITIPRLNELSRTPDEDNPGNDWDLAIDVVRPADPLNTVTRLLNDEDICSDQTLSACEIQHVGSCVEGGNIASTPSVDRVTFNPEPSLSFSIQLGDPLYLEVRAAELNGCPKFKCTFDHIEIINVSTIIQQGGFVANEIVLQTTGDEPTCTIKIAYEVTVLD